MEIHGKLNLVDSEVKSDEFASTSQFNKLVVNSLSEVDQGTLDHDVVIFNKEDDLFYTYDGGSDSWRSYLVEVNHKYDMNEQSVIYIDDEMDIFNQFGFDRHQENHLVVHPDMLDLGDIGSPVDCVIDFWLNPSERFEYGTILYNGLNTGPVNLEANKNMLITTSGDRLVRDPVNQLDPTTHQYPENDGYLQVLRPTLKSQSFMNPFLTHVAIVRSGDTTYLAINGKIEDSAESVEYFHYADVLIGTGYIRSSSIPMINLRVTKGTDLGWTTDFIPPNHNITPDANTHFLMDSTSVVDTTGNHEITVVGDAPVITQDQFYYQLTTDHIGPIITTNLVQDRLNLRVPYNLPSYEYYFKPSPDTKLNITLGNECVGLNDYEICQLRFDNVSGVHKVNRNHGKLIFANSVVKIPGSSDSTPAISTRELNYDSKSYDSYYTILRCDDNTIYDVGTDSQLDYNSRNVISTPALMPFSDSKSVIDCRVGDIPIWTEDDLIYDLSVKRGAWVDFLFYLTDDVVASQNIIYCPDPTTNLTIADNYLTIQNGSSLTSTLQLTKETWYHVILDYYFGYTSGLYQICQGTIEIAPLFSTTYHRNTLQGGRRTETTAYCFKTLRQGPWLMSTYRYRRTAYNSYVGGDYNNVGPSYVLTDFMKTGATTEWDHLKTTFNFS